MICKVLVIREIGSDDSRPYAVVEHETRTVGHRRTLKVHGWFERENDARALAHAMMFPDYEA